MPEGGWCHPLVVKASHCRPSASRRAGKPFFHSSASRLRGSGLPSSRNCDNFESSPGRRGLPTRMWCSSHLLFPVTSWQLQGGALPPLSCPVFAQAEPQAWLLHPPSLLMCSDPAFCTRQDCLRTATSIPRMLPRVLVDPLHGIRVGEAANPGPSTQPLITDFFRPNPESTFARAPSNCTDTSPEAEGVDLKLAVINPTALLGKESDIIGMQRNVYLISETSAVAQAQSIAASRFRQAQYKVQWSPPVPSHRCEGNATSLRGHAEGAAIVSNFPMRASFAGPPAAWKGSCRLVEGMLRIGWFSFRVISVYGFPANRAEAGLRNDELLRLALQTATSDHIPTLIGGDLNVEIQKLPVWRSTAATGIRSSLPCGRVAWALTCLPRARAPPGMIPCCCLQVFRPCCARPRSMILHILSMPTHHCLLTLWCPPALWCNIAGACLALGCLSPTISRLLVEHMMLVNIMFIWPLQIVWIKIQSTRHWLHGPKQLKPQLMPVFRRQTDRTQRHIRPLASRSRAEAA